MTLAKAVAAFAEAALDPKTTPAQRRAARSALAALGIVETPSPRIVYVEAPPTAEQIAAKALAENPQLRREYDKAEKAAASESRLTPKERSLLAKTSERPVDTRAYQSGSAFFTPFVSSEQARARLQELDAAKIAKEAEGAFPAPDPEHDRINKDRKPFGTRVPFLPDTSGRR